MFNLKNAYKLITKEDILSIHKILGIFSLIHYLYRFGLLIIPRYIFKQRHICFILYIITFTTKHYIFNISYSKK